MVLNPSMIFYSCIAKETTILAEFNSKDHPDLGLVALKCLAKTPLFHSNFSHTIRGKTYMFLIQEPFSYFAIFDENLENLDGLAFLESIKDAFDDGCTKKNLDSLSSHCFQGEFNPVFHQLLTASGEIEAPNSRRMGRKFVPERNSSMDSIRESQKIGNVPLLSGHGCTKKKKKMRFFDVLFWIGKGKDGGDRKVDVCDDDDSSLDFSASPMDKSNRSSSLASVDPVIFQRHAKKSWKKHVWIVLTLDLVICLIMFIVWLWVCRGLKCIDG